MRLALWVILAVAAAVRLPGIGEVGIRYDDGAAYAADARLWHRCVRLLADPAAWSAFASGDAAALAATGERHRIDFSDRYPKPCQGFTFLVAGMMFIFGAHADAVLITNAIFSVLSVLVLYGVARRWLGQWPAVVAALLLAIAPFHVVYARTGLVESTAGFFVLLGVYCWAQGRMADRSAARGYLFGGLALGYACTCHYRCAVIIAALFVYECVALIPRWRGGDDRAGFWRRVRCGAFMATGILAPAILLECVFRVARYSAVLLGYALPLATYFESVQYWLALVSAGAEGIDTPLVPWSALAVYGEYVLYFQGAAFVALASLGLWVGVRSAGLARAAAVVVLTSVAVLIAQPFTVARGLSAIVPFACLLAAAGAAAMWGARRTPVQPVRALAAAMLVLAVVAGAGRSFDLRDQRSDVPAAARFIAQRGGAVAGPTIGKYALYFDDARVEMVRLDRLAKDRDPAETLDLLGEMGVRWIITDPQRWALPPGGRHARWWAEFERLVNANCPVATSFAHLTGYRYEFLAEAGEIGRLAEMTRARAGGIAIRTLSAATSSPTLAARVTAASDTEP